MTKPILCQPTQISPNTDQSVGPNPDELLPEALAMLLALLQQDLTRSRLLSEQVLTTLSERYGQTPETVADFVQTTLPTLEDYEIDLLFAPLFTPRLTDRLPYVGQLNLGVLSSADIDMLIARLCQQKPVCLLSLDPSSDKTIPLALHEVTIRRYVSRLGLDAPLADILAQQFELLRAGLSDPEAAWLNVLGRDPIWQPVSRQALLTACLEVFQTKQAFTVQKFEALTDFVRTYRPASLPDLCQKLQSLIASCEKDLETLYTRRYHDVQLKETYAESEEAVAVDEIARVQATYKQHIANAQALLAVFI